MFLAYVFISLQFCYNKENMKVSIKTMSNIILNIMVELKDNVIKNGVVFI
jgi:hypothetical protein